MIRPCSGSIAGTKSGWFGAVRRICTSGATTSSPPPPWRKSNATVARKMQAFFGADYIEIDRHDDSVLFTQIDFSVGLYHVYRVASANGKVLERLDLHKAMNAIAATPDGRIYGMRDLRHVDRPSAVHRRPRVR